MDFLPIDFERLQRISQATGANNRQVVAQALQRYENHLIELGVIKVKAKRKTS